MSDLTKIDFDNIVIENVKYMPSMFNGDVILVFLFINQGVPNAYGNAMDDMDMTYDMFDAEPKQQTSKMDFL